MSAPSVVASYQKKYMRAFRKYGAVSPDSAMSLSELGVRENLVFHKLVSRGVLIRVGEDKYYMDEFAAKALVERRRKMGLALLLVLAAYFLVMHLFVRQVVTR